MQILVKSWFIGYDTVEVNDEELKEYEKVEDKVFQRIGNNFEAYNETKPIYKKISHPL